MLNPTVNKIPKQASTQNLIYQLTKYRSNNLIQKCICCIQEMESELERERKINSQQKYLINILQESKEYYEKQYKNNVFEQQCLRLREQNNRLSTLAAAHKKANHEMKQKFLELQERLEGRQTLLKQQDQVFYKLKLEKELLERQWNKAVKAVKKKIGKIVQESDNPQSQRKNLDKIHKDERPFYQRSAVEKGVNNQSLISRAKTMLKHIQKLQAIQQLQNIFLQQSSNKKRPQKSQLSDNSAVKMRKPLAELKQNVDLPFQVSFY